RFGMSGFIIMIPNNADARNFHLRTADSTGVGLCWAAATLPAMELPMPRRAWSFLLRAAFSLPDKVSRFRRPLCNPLLPRVRFPRRARARRKRPRGHRAAPPAANFG